MSTILAIVALADVESLMLSRTSSSTTTDTRAPQNRFLLRNAPQVHLIHELIFCLAFKMTHARSGLALAAGSAFQRSVFVTQHSIATLMFRCASAGQGLCADPLISTRN